MGELKINISTGETSLEIEGDSTSVQNTLIYLHQNGLGELNKNYNKSNKTDNKAINEKTSSIITISNKENLGIVNQESNEAYKIERNTKKEAISTPKKNQTKVTRPHQFQLIKNLDLASTKTRLGLKEFVNSINPTSNINITTTILYYMQNVYRYHEGITKDIIFTCWRELGLKLPSNLTANLRDICCSKYGYANVFKGIYSITTRGINFVEHKLMKTYSR